MLYYLLWLILCLAQVEIADIQKREKERYQNEKEKKLEKKYLEYNLKIAVKYSLCISKIVLILFFYFSISKLNQLEWQIKI